MMHKQHYNCDVCREKYAEETKNKESEANSLPEEEDSSVTRNSEEKLCTSMDHGQTLNECSYSPGNSLFGRETWSSSGFISNQSMDSDLNFNDVLQRALNTTGVMSGSPVQAVETILDPRSSEQFTDQINGRDIEVGRIIVAEAEGEAITSRRPESSLSDSPKDFEVIQPETTTPLKQSEISLLTKLPVQSGLDAQSYKCATCSRLIGLISRASKSFLEHIAANPLIDVNRCNPAIYEFVPEMKETFRLREQLSYVAMYLLTCKESVAEELRKRLWPKEYLYEHIHLYAVDDLLNVSCGQLQRSLKSSIIYAIGHVHHCRLCSQKGFICELCNKDEIIYPFQVDLTQRCSRCYSVFHTACFEGQQCPKCQRRDMYSKAIEHTDSTGSISRVVDSNSPRGSCASISPWQNELVLPPGV